MNLEKRARAARPPIVEVLDGLFKRATAQRAFLIEKRLLGIVIISLSQRRKSLKNFLWEDTPLNHDM